MKTRISAKPVEREPEQPRLELDKDEKTVSEEVRRRRAQIAAYM